MCLVIAGAATGILASQTSSSATSSPGTPSSASAPAPAFDGPPRDDSADVADGILDRADGVLPAGVTVFEDAYPAVARLNPDLLAALRAAATDAGIRFDVTSGWRSPEYQDQLLRDAISAYGSEEEAARWVATATTSAHVSGNAVDIGSSVATAWLAEHGAAFGLCQIYGNEPWHYELRPDAVAHGCPALYADPTQDPRMQQ